ncbi:MAG: protein-L-isoaspartate O-methyltransferase [Rhizobiaceae bacterium]
MSHADFDTLRIKMVDGQLRTTDVTNHVLLSAFLAMPREAFVPAAMQDLAYLDDDIDLGNGRYMMEPSPLARLIQLAEVKPADKVLVVGCGTGYGAAIIASIAANVVALEEDAELAAKAKSALASIGVTNVEVMTGPLAAGAASKSGFDVIIIEGAVDKVPASLTGQLAENGRLVAVEGVNLTGVARVHVKSGTTVSARRGFNLSVKPLVAFKAEPVFAF